MADRYAVATGNWTSANTWAATSGGAAGAGAPTNADNAIFDAASGNINVTIDSGATCADATFTGYIGTLTHTAAVTWTIKGSLTFVAGMTYTKGNATSSQISFTSTTTGKTVTTAGKSLGSVTWNTNGGGWTLQDALTTAGTLQMPTTTTGIFNSNGQNITARDISGTGTGARTVTFDGSAITLTGAGGTTIVNFGTSTNMTFSNTGTTYNLTGNGTPHTWAGGGLSYGAVTISAATTGGMTITGANTFASWVWSHTSVATLTLPASTTTTFTTAPAFRGGAAGKLLTILSSSAGTAATISVAAGTVRANHCSIKDSTATGGATFEAYDSIDVSGNTGWSFKRPARLALAGIGAGAT